MANIALEVLYGGLAALLDYMSAHVLTCLIPAFFIAGAISALLSKEAVLKYFGSKVRRYVSYGVASVSGTILAVCSCTILPLFAGIYKRGAGIGPATAFLYSGPAINILAIVYTANVLGYDIGLARALAAVTMAVVVGLSMEIMFEHGARGDGEHEGGDQDREDGESAMQSSSGLIGEDGPGEEPRPGWVVPLFFGLLVAILLVGASKLDWTYKFPLVYGLTIGVALILIYHFTRDEVTDWGYETWDLFKKIFPILLAGTFVVGMIAVVLPPETFSPYFGNNSLPSCLLAATVGVLLYMPTLLEVPIVGGTFGYTSGAMAPGPALALLLAGPAVSFPSLAVLVRVMGPRKTLVFALIVILISGFAGAIYGNTAVVM